MTRRLRRARDLLLIVGLLALSAAAGGFAAYVLEGML